MINLLLNSIIGLPLKEAEILLSKEGREIRVVKENDEYFVCTCEFNPLRINVEVRDGLVIEIQGIG